MTNHNSTNHVFKALMHPVRLSILEILREGEQCVCHLEAVLGHRQAYISQHLMVLREAGLVEDRRDGSRIFYHLTRTEVFDLVDAAVRLSGAEAFRSTNATGKNCLCPKCSPGVL